MARLTIVWVKEYAKANGIFLVKTSTGYAVQYQRLIDELTYENSVGYKEVFKTLKEVKNWIDDQNPVDVLGIDKEVAKEIYEDAKNFSDKVDRKDALNNITANTSLRFITAQSLVFGDVEKVISDLSHNRCNALSVFEGIGVLREYTFIHPMTLDRLNEKVNDYLLTLHPETKEEDKEESFNEVREYALAEIKEEVKTPLETYVDDVESRENWILSLTEDELDDSGLSDQEVSFWVKNQNKNEGYSKNEFHLKLSEINHPLALPKISPWQIRRSLYCTHGVKFPHPDEYEGFVIPNEEETEEAMLWLRKHKVIK